MRLTVTCSSPLILPIFTFFATAWRTKGLLFLPGDCILVSSSTVRTARAQAMAASPTAENSDAPTSQDEREDADKTFTEHKTARYHYQCNVVASSLGPPTSSPSCFNRSTYQPCQCKRWSVQEANGECNPGRYVLGEPRLSPCAVHLGGGDKTKGD
jgi:hypothetical protein